MSVAAESANEKEEGRAGMEGRAQSSPKEDRKNEGPSSPVPKPNEGTREICEGERRGEESRERSTAKGTKTT